MKYLSLILIVFTFKIFAHGENKLGPNLGYIRMPGPYHTELVPVKNGVFDVYLMTVNNQSPTIKDSEVVLNYESLDGKTKAFKCTKNIDKFTCSNGSKIDLTKGKISLKSKRESVVGSTAEYSLPLKLNSSN